jgi:hypothetical protein|tara:strand:+ start:3159 stop:3419 length:261 start_codon:yes stop_codon:yes gene_type:complete
MDVIKKTKVEVRDETLWAIKEALDNSSGFVVHVSWLGDDGVVRHYNSQRDFLIDDLKGVETNVSNFIKQNYEERRGHVAQAVKKSK